MSSDRTWVHFIAGGMGGTAGAALTCPFEVVKTRLQSSVAQFHHGSTSCPLINLRGVPSANLHAATYSTLATASVSTNGLVPNFARLKPNSVIYQCLRQIWVEEGFRGMFKGLGPNLVGVFPSRAIYFFSYAQTKSLLNERLTPETPIVHILAASTAGFTACTFTNPIWFIKTRLQLDQKASQERLTTARCIKQIYSEGGVQAFYKGITASYYGIVETVIHLTLYEFLKTQFREMQENGNNSATFNILEFMGAGAISKTTASCIAYPHEVARTRLRQSGNEYRSFWQTLFRVYREEGRAGLYRGLGTQLVRQIPNTAVMMAGYEIVVQFLS